MSGVDFDVLPADREQRGGLGRHAVHGSALRILSSARRIFARFVAFSRARARASSGAVTRISEKP